MTVYLAQKLMTMNLDKKEFEKTKWLRNNNIQEKYKAANSLKYILDKQLSNKTCRLCLQPGGEKIFGDNTDFDTVNNIRYILGIEITEGDGKPQHICDCCKTTVDQAAQLKQTAETTQWRLQQELDMVAESLLDGNPEEVSKHHGGYFRIHDMKISREWACSKCKHIFHTQEEFSEHEQLPTCRTKFRCYVCETCGLELKSMSRLNRHRLTHTGELHYPCSRCPYRARTKYALVVHERYHTGDRPVQCPHCPASFPNSSNLASHKRSHMPPRYHCDSCQKGFKFKEALRDHIATQHSNAKPYNCESCGKTFSTRKLMRRHELKVHNRPKMRSGVIPSYIRQHQDMYT